jgi:CheY-like chemotaxis protein
METNVSSPAPSALIVEDEALLLMLVAETLRDAGYTVYEAANGPVALSLLEVHTEIALMISDIRMPGMNGYQVTEAAMALRPDLRVVLMTGYTPEAVPKSISNTGVEILHKPFNVNQLPLLANRILDRD